MTWMNALPDRLRASLDSLLDSVDQHEDSYMEAENPSIGQLWVALARINQRMDRLEKMMMDQRKAIRELGSGVEFDRRLDRDLEESLKRY